MKKAEAERAIRHLSHEWGDAFGIPRPATDQPSFYAFKEWCGEKGYGHYFDFRSAMGAHHDAEQWFDEEFCQAWRN